MTVISKQPNHSSRLEDVCGLDQFLSAQDSKTEYRIQQLSQMLLSAPVDVWSTFFYGLYLDLIRGSGMQFDVICRCSLDVMSWVAFAAVAATIVAIECQSVHAIIWKLVEQRPVTTMSSPTLLSIDEAKTYRTAIVIVFGSNGRKYFCSQLNNSKRKEIDHVSKGSK